MILFKIRLFLVCLLMLVTACQLGFSAPEDLQIRPSKYVAEPQSPMEILWVDSVMLRLSARERLAQLFMMAAYSNLDAKHENSVKKLVQENKIGGLIFFQGTPEKQIELTNLYQSVAKIPLIISMDAEWGVGMRLHDVSDFPRQMALGSIRDNSLIYELGAEIARQCKLLGVHINFAPVVDVNNNPNNPVINARSFGENQQNVAAKGIALMQGMQDNGVMACAKHFPGHGDTDTDSHKSLPVLSHPKERLDSIELKPFKRLIEEGIKMIMIGHLYVKSLENADSELPASISETVIKKLLRNEMSFQGLVISDALNMNGVKNHAAGKNVAVEALKAGHDILLMPFDVETNIIEIEKAIKRGEISQSEIDKKCRKVLTAKYRAGLTKFTPLNSKGIRAAFNSPQAQSLRNRLTEKSIILVSNTDNLLPFRELDNRKFGYLAVGGFASGYSFLDRLGKYTTIAAKCEVSTTPTALEIRNIKSSFKDCDVIVVGYHVTTTGPRSKYGVSQAVFDLLGEISSNKKIALVYFGSPYFLSYTGDRPYLTSTVVAHSNSDEAQDRAAQQLFGGIPFSGKMPVSASPEFPEGTGIETYNSIRLKYVIPEEAGIGSRLLKSVDSLVSVGIAQKAFPGCQILAAHKGEVFYHKAFGAQSYNALAPKVKISDVYDVASVTKVAATLPLVMRMVDERTIEINNPLKKYLTLNSHSDKGNLLIKDILLHQSGLPSWIPFHFKYLVTPEGKPAISNKKSTESVKIPGTAKYLQNDYILDPKYFASHKSGKYKHGIADNIFVSDEVRNEIYALMDTCKLMTQIYRYSDLGFMYLQRVIESIYNVSEDKLAQTLLYEPLGMNRTGYLPLEKIALQDIPPTEDDKLFRKQLLRGYVHDHSASLCGGVAGNAGLFSNVNDLAKLYQMFLNGGIYGGLRYLTEETIVEFTACAECRQGNRRSLGFDKPESDTRKKNPVCKEASLQSYGHLGFTGAMVWIDPQRELVFIFLSNRINPTADNNKLSTLGTRNEILARFINAIDNKEIIK